MDDLLGSNSGILNSDPVNPLATPPLDTGSIVQRETAPSQQAPANNSSFVERFFSPPPEEPAYAGEVTYAGRPVTSGSAKNVMGDNWVSRTTDFLNALGLYPTMGAINETLKILEEDNNGVPLSGGDVLDRLHTVFGDKTKLARVADASKKGFLQESTLTTRDVLLDRYFPEDDDTAVNGFMRGALGLTGDVLLDWTNLIPGKWIGSAIKGTAKVGMMPIKAAGRAAGFEMTGLRQTRQLTEMPGIGRRISRALSRQGDLPGDIYDPLRNLELTHGAKDEEILEFLTKWKKELPDPKMRSYDALTTPGALTPKQQLFKAELQEKFRGMLDEYERLGFIDRGARSRWENAMRRENGYWPIVLIGKAKGNRPLHAHIYDELADEGLVGSPAIVDEILQTLIPKDSPGFFHARQLDQAKLRKSLLDPSVSVNTKAQLIRTTVKSWETYASQIDKLRELTDKGANRSTIIKYLDDIGMNKSVFVDSLGSLNQFDRKAFKRAVEIIRQQYMPVTDMLEAGATRMVEHTNMVMNHRISEYMINNFGSMQAKLTDIPPIGFTPVMPFNHLRSFLQKNLDESAFAKSLPDLVKTYGDFIPEGVAKQYIEGVVGSAAVRKFSMDAFPVWHVDNRLVSYMGRYHNTLQQAGSDEVAAFGRLAKGMYNGWKAGATYWRPKFHIRNAISNVHMMWESGMPVNTIPYYMKRGIDVRTASKMKAGEYRTILGQKMDKAGLLHLNRNLEELGVKGRGFFGGDSQISAYLAVKKELDTGSGLGIKSLVRKGSDAGKLVGTVIEDNARIAAFLYHAEKGLKKVKGPITADLRAGIYNDAARKVRKWLIDYTELSMFEGKVAKNMFPFYTFARRNLVNQFEVFFTDPKKVQKTGKLLQNVGTAMPDYEERNRPEWFDPLMYIRMPRSISDALMKQTGYENKSNSPLYLSLDVPLNDVNRLLDMKNYVGGLGKYITNQLNPLLKLGAEAITNKSTFTSVDISRFEGDKVVAPLYLSWFPESTMHLAAKSGVIGYMWHPQTHQRVIGVDKWFLHSVNSAFPLLKEFGDFSGFSVPGVGQMGISVRDEKPSQMFWSYITGMNMKVFNPDEYSLYKMYKDEEDAKKQSQRMAQQPWSE